MLKSIGQAAPEREALLTKGIPRTLREGKKRLAGKTGHVEGDGL
jgi:hypothetical protein